MSLHKQPSEMSSQIKPMSSFQSSSTKAVIDSLVHARGAGRYNLSRGDSQSGLHKHLNDILQSNRTKNEKAQKLRAYMDKPLQIVFDKIMGANSSSEHSNASGLNTTKKIQHDSRTMAHERIDNVPNLMSKAFPDEKMVSDECFIEY